MNPHHAPNLLHLAGSRMEIICVDLDSTLADTRQRRRHCPTVDPTSDWTRYAMLCGGDAPIAGTVRLVRILHAAGYGIHIVSNRPEAARALTEQWLHRQHIQFEALRLRTADEPYDANIKVGYIHEIREQGYEPLLFLEDWPATAEQIEKIGVPVLCVNPCYPEKDTADTAVVAPNREEKAAFQKALADHGPFIPWNNTP